MKRSTVEVVDLFPSGGEVRAQQEFPLTRRRWEWTDFGQLHRRQPHYGLEFTVVSYNLLSQSLLEENFHLYTHCKSWVLQWEYRKKKMLEELDRYNSDILCFQEIDCSRFNDFFEPELRLRGYQGKFQKRTGDKNDGCAIFFKNAKFVCFCVHGIKYHRGELLNRDNVALVIGLMPRNPAYQCWDNFLFVATTHILFNPKRGDVKLSQLMVLFASLDEITYKSQDENGRFQYNPIILCGDFNSEPYSNIYNFVSTGYLYYRNLLIRTMSGQKEGMYGRDVYLQQNYFPKQFGISDKCQFINVLHSRLNSRQLPLITQNSGLVEHQLNFASVYQHSIERLHHQECEVTTQHDTEGCVVDYIFYTVNSKEVQARNGQLINMHVNEGKLKLIGRYGLISGNELQETGGLPNVDICSDHLALMARFLLT